MYRICCFVLAVALSYSAGAHIVPLEEFHPVAEAYRRTAFLLNLNPVLWEQVKSDAALMAEKLRAIDPDGAAALEKTVGDAIARCEAEATISVATPQMRKETARAVFEAETRAVASAIVAHLNAAKDALANYEGAVTHYDAARQIWQAFDHEVQYADPLMHNALGMAWLDCASALGSPGVGGVGMVPPNPTQFNEGANKIMAYVAANFGPEFRAPEDGRLIALPQRSESFDRNAAIPAKLPPGADTNKQLPRPRQVLNMAARGVNETETTLIALGDMAFDSPYIFGDPARSLQISCNTCHNKSITNPKFFIPGLSNRNGAVDVSNSFFAPHANNGHFDPLDIPDLRGIRFTAPYGRNGRFASLREFTRNVIVNEFNGPEPAPVVLDAMIAYMNEFDFLPNPQLNPKGTLKESAPAAAKRGEEIFNKPFAQMNNMSCATCHVPSNHFLDNKKHDIGSVHGTSDYSRDGALDTPTLLSSRWSGPYFHDGRFDTLGEVVDWFNDEYKLEMSDDERADLTTYLEVIGDGEDAYEDTMYTLEAEMEEFSFFLSSYEYVKRIGQPEILATLCRTVADEIRAHKWDVQDQSQLTVLDELATIMDEAYTAILAGNLDEADTLVAKYRALYEEHAEKLV